MARKEIEDNRVFNKYWKAPPGGLQPQECMKSLIKLIGVGDIDLSKYLIPKGSQREKFEWKCLNERDHSNPTFKVTYRSGTALVNFVVKMKPPDEKYEFHHRVNFEFEVLSCLYKAGIPVPKPWYSESRVGVIGTEFFIMEFVEGRVFNNPNLSELQGHERKKVYDSLAKVAAQIHNAVIPDALQELFRETNRFESTRDFWKWDIGNWSRNYSDYVSGPGNDATNHLMQRLKNIIPPLGKIGLIHRDFGFNNVVFDNKTFEVKAVVDWEMCCIGDTYADLAYLAMMFLPFDQLNIQDELKPLLNKMIIDGRVFGIPSEQEFFRSYSSSGGVCDAKVLLLGKASVCARFISIFQTAHKHKDKHESDFLRPHYPKVIQLLTEIGQRFLSTYH